MSTTQRIRTELGINKVINVELEQDFNYLEILSLKIQQEDVYNKSCAQYGVVVGRVTANNGYGVPNAKVSIFIPITQEDEFNPIISSIYPYKSLEDKNEDGYRYNLLPYEKSHTNHTPTGTFPSINDVLVDKTAIEIYEKYYKYTVKTNDSGDYMILGVPLGIQVIVMDLDLSDMGEFSLTPQDLIRMGRATEAQVSGRQFKSSSNLNSLPQIISLSKSFDVSPLWGDPEICQIAINRVDFDLRDDANIDIQPTAVFMGSLISSADNKPLRVNCKPPTEMGNLCSLVAGPGQIVSIRQTVNQDEFGRPILEQFNFDGGNEVIDQDGSWLVDLPMNLDYLTTNEFGEKIISNDPTLGIPTKARYRFKVKWNQSEDLGQQVRRGYYLVPNVREYGWDGSSDPKDAVGRLYEDYVRSYAFSLDWGDYGFTGDTRGRTMISSAINCEDKFYEFRYNQVYTVSNLIDLYQKGTNRGRFIGIKQITDTSCESTNYKFPTNDGVRNFDFLFEITNFILTILQIQLLSILPILHILAFIWPLFKLLFTFVYSILAWIVYGLCKIIKIFKRSTRCTKPLSPKEIFNKIGDPFKKIKVPCITYPECEICNCQTETIETNQGEAAEYSKRQQENYSISCSIDTQDIGAFSNILDRQYCLDDPLMGGINSIACKFLLSDCNCVASSTPAFSELMAGNGSDDYWKRTPANLIGDCNGTNGDYHSQDLTLSERLNLFNTKGKYFNNLSSQGGGWNQIRVAIRPDLNGGLNNTNGYHFDNVTVVVIDSACAEQFTTGKLVSFNGVDFSKDVNISSGQSITYLNRDGEVVVTNATTGYAKNNSSITVNFADPNNSNNQTPLSRTYLVDQSSNADFSLSDFNGPTGQIGDGDSVSFTFVFNKVLQPKTVIITDGVETFTDNGNGTMIGSVSGVGTVDYSTGYINLVFTDAPQNSVSINTSYTFFTTPGQGTQNYVIQKFPTDIEYFQVITATTYGEFVSKNPTIPVGQYNTSTRTYFNSLQYRYLGNFQTMWAEELGVAPFRYKTDDTFRPIYSLPDQKEFVVLFLLRGVDPHSSRQNMQIDLSKLYGYSVYNTIVVSGDYKLNIPIQPGLVLPRHNLVTNTNNPCSQTNKRIFFDSFFYDTTTSFRTYNTNLIENYSSLDSTTLSTFQVDPSNTYTILSQKANLSNGYLVTENSINLFGTSSYYTNTTALPRNAGVYSNEGWFCQYNNPNEPGVNNPYTLNLNSTGIEKQHRGYYDQEYIEGGSYFYSKIADFSLGVFTFDRVYKDSFIYFSPAYKTGTTQTTFSQGTDKVVMRSDRLPTSTGRKDIQDNNTFLLHQNRELSYFTYDDDGTLGTLYVDQTIGYTSGNFTDDEQSQFEESISNTFSCQGLVPLKCYEGSGESFGVKPQGDSCYSKPSIVRDGCYVFVDKPILRLINDFIQFGEWKTRFKVNLAACRGVFGHTFNNNWINGTLYAFPIKNKRFFTSPFGSNPNQPFNKFCKDTIILHPTSNNMYYRSSPFNYNRQKFVGKNITRRNGRNTQQLLYPTTVMNMGPRDEFAYELTLSEDYFGYNMQNISQTSYQDISSILNLFIVSRQISSTFLQQLFSAGDASVQTFFSRRNSRFDGDYAQAISINSELGVDEFDFDSYDFSTGSTTNNTFYVRNKTVGIFFSGNTQSRDYISPRRIIRDDTVIPGVYDNLGFNSQVVPFYNWRINSGPSIFGTEKNDWATTSNTIKQFNYQSLDRTDITYNYFMGQINLPIYMKGYIYNVALNVSTGQVEFEGDTVGPLTNSGPNYTVGAPFFFYFGLKRGNNALDKFNKKFLGVETI